MKKIVKALIASVAIALLLLSSVVVLAPSKHVNAQAHEQENVIICYKGDEWENS